MSGVELKECTRLRAKITQRQCDINRKRVDDPFKDVWAVKQCVGCPGLGIEVEEIKEAAFMRGTCTTCGRPDLTLPVKDTCGKCYSEKRKAAGIQPPPSKQAKSPGKVVGKAAVKAPIIIEDADLELCPLCGVSPCCCHIVAAPDVVNFDVLPPAVETQEVVLSDMGLEITQLFSNKQQEWLADLGGATTARSRAQLFLAMCDSLEGLVH